MRGTSAISTLLFGVVVAGFVVGTSGCSTGFFLYELFKGDDDDTKSTTTTVADAAVAAAVATADATASEPVDAATGPCAVATHCGDAGVCSLAATCEQQKSDGESCVASWECTGGYCAWNASEGTGVCASAVGSCKNTQTGCTADAHSCCEGSRCNPAQFGALPQCVTCNITGIACDELGADTCCSGTCSFGKCG